MELQDFLDHVNSGAPDRGRLASSTGSCTTPHRRRSGSPPRSTPDTAHPTRCAPCSAELTGKPIDDSVVVFPPFYSEFGKNLTLGKDVFINLGCRFQDTGGITIGDGTLIGHGSTLTTLNHDVDPDRRADMMPAPILHRPQSVARSRRHRRPRRHHRRRSDRRRRRRRHQGRTRQRHRRRRPRQAHPHDRIQRPAKLTAGRRSSASARVRPPRCDQEHRKFAESAGRTWRRSGRHDQSELALPIRSRPTRHDRRDAPQSGTYRARRRSGGRQPEPGRLPLNYGGTG